MIYSRYHLCNRKSPCQRHIGVCVDIAMDTAPTVTIEAIHFISIVVKINMAEYCKRCYANCLQDLVLVNVTDRYYIQVFIFLRLI